VTYAVSGLRSAMGENRLMPKPELECMVINAKSGYARANHSWILSRLVRDFEHWRSVAAEVEKKKKLQHLRDCIENQRVSSKHRTGDSYVDESRAKPHNPPDALPKPQDARVALRITIWECISSPGQGSGDLCYWLGFVVSLGQLGISAIPWGLYGEWFTLFATATGTTLAYLSGALPQWVEEKSVTKRLSKSKAIFLTQGNGSDEVILILCHKGDIDIEALASPRRVISSPFTTRVLSSILAVMWVAFLITVASWEQHSWYLVGVGMIGILHNVATAGAPRQPRAWGIDLQYVDTIVEDKVMKVLHRVEELYPRAGLSLLPEFFPGDLFPRETKLWNYARARHTSWEQGGCRVDMSGKATAWAMPPLRRPGDRLDDEDIILGGSVKEAT
ncbi:hypothetical protein LTR17_023170, partial [Elasticomyces elasticus]